jgi:hypothetical protein
VLDRRDPAGHVEPDGAAEGLARQREHDMPAVLPPSPHRDAQRRARLRIAQQDRRHAAIGDPVVTVRAAARRPMEAVIEVPERPGGRERIRQDAQRQPFLPPDREGRGRSRGRTERHPGARNAARQRDHQAKGLEAALRRDAGPERVAMMRRFMAAFLRIAEKDRPRAAVGYAGL